MAGADPQSADGAHGDEPLVEVGRFERPHGVRGEIAFFPGEGPAPARGQGSSPPGAEFPYRTLHCEGRTLAVLAVRPKGDRLLLTIEGIASPEEARAALTGRAAFVPRRALPELPEGAFYLRELVGMALVDTATGKIAGRVREVERIAGRDYLELEGGALIPLADELLDGVDAAARTISMRIPEGLLDLDAAEQA